jgi:glycine cleavage system aminomethyltransferase T
MRLGDRHFRVVTGAFDGPRDGFWFRSHLPADGSVDLVDLTSAFTTIGVWGPHARALIASLTEDDISDGALPYGTSGRVVFGSLPARLFRISYVGESGWEIYVPIERGRQMWDLLWEAGQDYGVVPVGAGVYGTSGRLEKGYRLMGAELESEYSPVEAGLDRPRVKEADFIGKEAYVAARERGPAAVLCTFTVDDHTSPRDGIARFMTGGEPILGAAGDRLVDERGRPSYVTSAGAGPSLGAYLLMGYVPADLAVEGSSFLVRYMNEDYPITLARAGSRPLFDPDDSRMKG